MNTLLFLLLASGFAPTANVIVLPPKRPDLYTVYVGTNSGIYTFSTNFPGTNTTGTVTNFVKGKTNFYALTATDEYGVSPYSKEMAFMATNTAKSITLIWEAPPMTNYLTIGMAVRCLTNLVSTNRTLVYHTNWITLTNPTTSPQYFDGMITITNKQKP